MGTLVLLRHGQSSWNAENLFTGWVDVPLTETGEQEARRGGELLREEHLRQGGFFVSIEMPDTPGVIHPGLPFSFSALRVGRTGQAARLCADTGRYLTHGWDQAA